MTVVSVLDGQREALQFKDAVTELSLSAAHLIVVTATQLCIHATSNFNTPHVVELRGTVSLLLRSSRSLPPLIALIRAPGTVRP